MRNIKSINVKNFQNINRIEINFYYCRALSKVGRSFVTMPRRQRARPFSPMFDEEMKQMNGCCGCVSVCVGTKIFAVMELMVYTAVVGLAVYGIAVRVDHGRNLLMGIAVAAAIFIICIISAFYGIKIENFYFVIPYGIVQVTCIAAIAITVILLFVTIVGVNSVLVDYSDLYPSGLTNATLSFLAADVLCPLIVYFIFKVWILVVIIQCCKFLKEKKVSDARAAANANFIVQTTETSPYKPLQPPYPKIEPDPHSDSSALPLPQPAKLTTLSQDDQSVYYAVTSDFYPPAYIIKIDEDDDFLPEIPPRSKTCGTTMMVNRNFYPTVHTRRATCVY